MNPNYPTSTAVGNAPGHPTNGPYLPPADTTGRHYTVFGPVPLNYTPTTTTHKLSRHGVKNATNIFDRHDTNKSGYIAISELNPVLQEVFAAERIPPPNPSDVAYVLDKHDMDNDRKLSKREFKRLLKELGGMKKYDRGTIGGPKAKRHPQTHVFQQAYEGTQVTRTGVTGVLNEQSGYPGFYTPQTGIAPVPQAQVLTGTPFGPVPPGYHPRVYGITNPTIKRSHDIFNQYDVNHDGYISLYELPNLLAAAFAADGLQPPYPTDVAYLLQKYDFNNDHRLSYWEFKRLLKELNGSKKFDRSTITVYKYQRAPGQPGYAPGYAPGQVGYSRVPYPQPTNPLPVNTAYSTIPTNHVPRDFILSRGAIRASKYIFRKYDVQHTGYIGANQLDDVIREVFVHDGQQAPTTADIAYALNHYEYHNKGQYTQKEVKRILKSITKTKTYNKGNFGLFSKGPTNRV